MARSFDPDDLDPHFRLIRKFDDAWRADLALIRELSRQEEQEEANRAYAAELAGVTVNGVSDDVRRMAILVDDHDDDDNDDDDDDEETNNENEEIVNTNNASSTRTTTTKNPYAKSKPKECASCMERVSKKDPLTPCNHRYHVKCLKQLFTLSMQDETLMPPRCCGHEIPVALPQLTFRELEKFNAKRLEFSTTDRVYCSKPTCSTFIPPALIANSVGTCPKPGCGVTTCSICKAASHVNRDCPKDDATAAVLAAGQEAGWARCYRCRALVELAIGCNHMTCRCRAEFCYLCSKPWKNCPCAQWDEARLFVEARVRTARIPAREIPRTDDMLDANQLIEQMANQLRANHECRHAADGRTHEEEVNVRSAVTIYPSIFSAATSVIFMACNRCRRNRL